MHRAYKSFLAIRYTMIFHITECINEIQINNNNEISLLYMLNTFYLYHKYTKQLSGNCSKMHRSQINFLIITTMFYTLEYTNKVQINNSNKILLSL